MSKYVFEIDKTCHNTTGRIFLNKICIHEIIPTNMEDDELILYLINWAKKHERKEKLERLICG